MKTKNKIGIIALLAIITLALIACEEDDPGPPELPVDFYYQLVLHNSIIIQVNFKMKLSEPYPTYLARLQDRLDSISTSKNVYPPTATAMLIDRLRERKGNYSINVQYHDQPYEGFFASDGQTLHAHNSWLTTESFENADIERGFGLMLDKPAVTQ